MNGMNILTLEQIKTHIRMDMDEHDEDMLLETFGEAAEQAVLSHIDRTWGDLYDEYGECPRAVEVAMLQIVADLYKNREYTSNYTPQLNPTMEMMIKSYVKLA